MAWQYCECGAEINPLDEDIIVGIVECGCGREVHINALEDRQRELLREMYRDIQELKKDVSDLKFKPTGSNF